MKKYIEFINESKKEDCIIALKKMLDKKPKVKTGGATYKRSTDLSEKYPDVKGIYSLSAMKRYLTTKDFTNNNVDKAVEDLQRDKDYKLKSINVKNFIHNEMVPHYYHDLTSTEAKKIKKDLESESKKMNLDKKEIKKPKKKSPKKKK